MRTQWWKHGLSFRLSFAFHYYTLHSNVGSNLVNTSEKTHHIKHGTEAGWDCCVLHWPDRKLETMPAAVRSWSKSFRCHMNQNNRQINDAKKNSDIKEKTMHYDWSYLKSNVSYLPYQCPEQRRRFIAETCVLFVYIFLTKNWWYYQKHLVNGNTITQRIHWDSQLLFKFVEYILNIQKHTKMLCHHWPKPKHTL